MGTCVLTPGEKTHTRTPLTQPRSLTGPGSPQQARKCLWGRSFLLKMLASSLKMPEAHPRSQGWHTSVLPVHCFVHICETRPIRAGKRMGEPRAWEMVCGSGKNVGRHRIQNLYFVNIIVLHLSILSSLFSFSFSLHIFCGGPFFKRSFWKLLPVSAVPKGNKRKGFFPTWIRMLKVQDHEGPGC